MVGEPNKSQLQSYDHGDCLLQETQAMITNRTSLSFSPEAWRLVGTPQEARPNPLHEQQHCHHGQRGAMLWRHTMQIDRSNRSRTFSVHRFKHQLLRNNYNLQAIASWTYVCCRGTRVACHSIPIIFDMHNMPHMQYINDETLDRILNCSKQIQGMTKRLIPHDPIATRTSSWHQSGESDFSWTWQLDKALLSFSFFFISLHFISFEKWLCSLTLACCDTKH